MVSSVPTKLTPVSLNAQSLDIKLIESTPIRFSTGYSHILSAGTHWKKFGEIPEGVVYQPVDAIFSIEGRQVHEAYLVIDNQKRLVGFYLPGEQRYSQLDKSTILELSPFP